MTEISDTALGVLAASALFGAFIGLCIKFGAIPGQGFRLLRRADRPEAFGATLTIMSVMFCGCMIIVLFVDWAARHASALTAVR